MESHEPPETTTVKIEIDVAEEATPTSLGSEGEMLCLDTRAGSCLA